MMVRRMPSRACLRVCAWLSTVPPGPAAATTSSASVSSSTSIGRCAMRRPVSTSSSITNFCGEKQLNEERMPAACSTYCAPVRSTVSMASADSMPACASGTCASVTEPPARTGTPSQWPRRTVASMSVQ